MRTPEEMEAVLFDADILRQEARACTRLAHMQLVSAKRDALLAIRRDCLRLARYLDDTKGVEGPRAGVAGRHAA